MAVAFTHLTSAGDTTNATTYSTASVTPTAGSLLIVCFSITDADDPGTMTISSTLSGVTWVERSNQPWNTIATPTKRTKVWTGTGHSGSGTITVSGMPDACQGALHFVVEATGYDTTTPVVQSPTSADDSLGVLETLTFAAYESSSNAAIAFFTKTLLSALTSEAGWTAVDTEKTFATPDQRMWGQYQTSATDTTSTMTWTPTNAHSAGAGLEIRVAATATDRFTDRIGGPMAQAVMHSGVR